MNDWGFNMEPYIYIWSLTKTGILAVFGGIAAYCYKIIRKDNPIKFSWLTFFIMCILAYFMGALIGSFLPENYANRDGVLMVAGYCSYPLCALLENKYNSIFYKFLS